jgi:hypothetical protein
MIAASIDLDYATFKQHFLNRVQRRQMGINLAQDKARAIYSDDAALHKKFILWKMKTGRPVLAATTSD